MTSINQQKLVVGISCTMHCNLHFRQTAPSELAYFEKRKGTDCLRRKYLNGSDTIRLSFVVNQLKYDAMDTWFATSKYIHYCYKWSTNSGIKFPLAFSRKSFPPPNPREPRTLSSCYNTALQCTAGLQIVPPSLSPPSSTVSTTTTGHKTCWLCTLYTVCVSCPHRSTHNINSPVS